MISKLFHNQKHKKLGDIEAASVHNEWTMGTDGYRELGIPF